jgi:hypothetical protein
LRLTRIVTVVIASGGLGLGCLASLGGCGDESKTTGTQVQITPADQAAIEDMRAAMKGNRAAQRKEQIEDRKERKAGKK